MDCCGSSRARRAHQEEKDAQREAEGQKKQLKAFNNLMKQAGSRAGDIEAEAAATAHLKVIRRQQVEEEFEARLGSGSDGDSDSEEAVTRRAGRVFRKGAGSRRRDCHSAAPTLPLAGVSTGKEMGCQQGNSLADG